MKMHKKGIYRKGNEIHLDSSSMIGKIDGMTVVVSDSVSNEHFTMVGKLYGDLYEVIRLREKNRRDLVRWLKQ